MTSLLSYSNRILLPGEWETVTGTVSNALTNLSTMQAPIPFVTATPDEGAVELKFTAHDSSGEPESFFADTFGALGLTDASSIAERPGLPDGALIEFLDGSTLIASAEWAALTNRSRPSNVFALSEDKEINDFRMRISNAGSNPFRISGVWAGLSIRKKLSRDWDIETVDYSSVIRAESTPWPNMRRQADIVPGRFGLLSEDEAYGINGGRNFKYAFEKSGTSSPVVYITDTSTSSRIAHLSVYGLLRAGWSIQREQGMFFSAQFEVKEIR